MRTIPTHCGTDAPGVRDDLSTRLRRRFEKEGRGQGDGASYVPGRNQHELSRSRGRMHRFACARCGGRQVVLPSDQALSTFLLEHWDGATCDLHEYFPLLDVGETVQLAARLGVRHPRLADGSPAILVSDLTVCRQSADGFSWSAMDTVPARSGAARHAGPRLMIIGEVWRRAGIPWRLVRSAGLNDLRSMSLWQLFGYAEEIIAWGLTDDERHARDAVCRQIRGRSCGTVREACAAAAVHARMPIADCIRAMLQLFATREVECRLDVPDLLGQPVSGLRLHAVRGAG